MTTATTARAEACHLLRDHLYMHLDIAQEFSEIDLPGPLEADRGQRLISDLAEVIRAVLVSHKQNDDVICTNCNRFWPCPTVEVVYTSFRDAEGELMELVREAGK